jgi:hypothetical protein
MTLRGVEPLPTNLEDLRSTVKLQGPNYRGNQNLSESLMAGSGCRGLSRL